MKNVSTVLVLPDLNSTSCLKLETEAKRLFKTAVPFLMNARVNKSGHTEQSHGIHCDASVVLNSSVHKLIQPTLCFSELQLVTLAQLRLSSCKILKMCFT